MLDTQADAQFLFSHLILATAREADILILILQM